MEPSKVYKVKQCGFTVYCKKHLGRSINEKESTLRLTLLLVLIFQLVERMFCKLILSEFKSFLISRLSVKGNNTTVSPSA